MGGGFEHVWGGEIPHPNSRAELPEGHVPTGCSAKFPDGPDVVRCILGDV